MSIPVSTLPTVKAWLYTQLQTACTAAGGVDLLVRYGDPGPMDPQDVVSVSDAQRTVTPWAMTGSLGAGSLYETYTIDVLVDVMRAGDDPAQASTERAWTLASQVESAVRADPTCGGVAMLARPETSHDLGEWDDNHSFYRVSVTVPIYVEAGI